MIEKELLRQKDILIQLVDSRIVSIFDFDKSSIEEMSTFTFPDMLSGNGDINNASHNVCIQKVHMHEVLSKDLPIDIDHKKLVRHMKSLCDVTNGFIYLSNDNGSLTCIECFGKKKNRFFILTHRHYVVKSKFMTQLKLLKIIKK